MARAPRILLACIAPFLLATRTPAQASGQNPNIQIDTLVDSLRQVRSPVNAIISPDGRKLAWTVGTELHLTALTADGSREPNTSDRLLSPDTIADPNNRRPGACPSSHPAWSPDGTRLAFLARCFGTDGRWQPNTQDDIFVLTLATNSLKQVSHLHGAVSSIQWSPDSKTIAFLYVEGATRRAGALDAMKPWNGVYGEDGVEVQRVYALDPQNGSGGWISASRSLHVYEFSWSPDSKQITYVAANPPGENTWWVAKLYVQTVGTIYCLNNPCAGLWAGNGPPKVILDPVMGPGPLHGMQLAVPRFSPDGKQIAFIAGLMSDQGATGGDIYIVNASAASALKEPDDVTSGIDGTPCYESWISDHTISFVEDRRGHTLLSAVNINSRTIVPGAPIDLGEVSISGGTLKDEPSVSDRLGTSKDRAAAFVEEGFSRAPEIYAGLPGHLTQITHLNDAMHPTWGHAESINYTNGGFNLQGWLLYPTNYDPTKKYPLIVSVHGGPSGAVTPRWPTASYGAIPFSALGYFVFLPNPRGSFGQGEKFTEANIRDFGYGDLSDILAGVDVLEKRFPIDTHREGITGWSYGGFMTMFAVTQTNRFRAAVAGAGISNWQSYYGENSIDQWMLPFFGASAYDDPAIYAKSSPINFIKQAHTPTLVVVGDRDGECPAPQSFEFWHALRDLNVKTQLVIYPNEGHHFTDPAHQTDVLKRALNWFQTEMQ